MYSFSIGRRGFLTGAAALALGGSLRAEAAPRPARQVVKRIVLVQGVPETSAVWDLLVDELVALGHDEPLRLSPPGFGAPVPDGWAATLDDYTAWLADELENIGHPVDLVGHDFGGGYVLNVAMTRPDLIRTWASDVVGTYHKDYVWPDHAVQWQTPGVGEQVVAAMVEQSAEERAAFLAGGGMNPVIAARIAPGIDEAMGACMLPLYRSAVQPVLAELAERLEAATARPGLAIVATENHGVGTDEQCRHAAARAGARVGVLEGLGHWWMTQDPRRAASLLNTFWSSTK
jgi:pimeloyl-ACP methyl ester carboxylesterase